LSQCTIGVSLLKTQKLSIHLFDKHCESVVHLVDVHWTVSTYFLGAFTWFNIIICTSISNVCYYISFFLSGISTSGLLKILSTTTHVLFLQ